MPFLRGFNVLTALTLFWAFLMVAHFAMLGPLPTVTFSLAFVAALLARRHRLELPNLLWLFLSITAIGSALYGWFVINERFLSVIYVFLYLSINKLWTAERNRDYLQLFGLSFFLVLGASVVTASVLFAPAMMVYLFLVLASLIAVTVKGDAEVALTPRPARRPGRLARAATALWCRVMRRPLPAEPPPAPARLEHAAQAARLQELFATPYFTRAHSRWLFGLLSVILIIGSGIFVIIPRVQANSLFSGLGFGGQSNTQSGFTDTVEFTEMGEIQTDPTIAMRAIPGRGFPMEGGAPAIEMLRLRGTALDQFDGRRWSRGSEVMRLTLIEDRSRQVNFRRRGAYERSAPMQMTIQMQPNRRRYLFGPDRTHAYFFDRDVVAEVDRLSECVQVAPWADTITYRVEASLPLREWEEVWRAETARRALAEAGAALIDGLNVEFLGNRTPLRALSRQAELDAFIERVYTQLPENDDMEVVRRLAREWGGEETDRITLARRIENRLRFDYEYSLDVSFASARDHLTEFLVRQRRGHCEYFATAMALMLRTYGIPTRIINGYASDEWVGSGGGYYLVRQEHAHSWVEVYFPDAGWIAFDPTPASGIGNGRVPPTLYRLLTRWMDTARLWWYVSVIDFDARDQTFLYAFIFRALDRLPDPTKLFDRFWWSDVLRPGSSANRQALLGLIGLGLLVLVALLVRELRRMLHWRGGATAGARRAGFVAATAPPEYLRLLAIAERAFPRPAGQTPREYARRLATQQAALADLQTLTELYYGNRFSNGRWTSSEDERARQLIAALGRITAAKG